MTTATQKFIEDAIAGGWGLDGVYDYEAFPDGVKVYLNNAEDERASISIDHIILDPLAWQAVGKTRGEDWDEGETTYTVAGWHAKWRIFIDHLADGLSIEGALSKL